MSAEDQSIRDLATRFFDAIEAGDIAAMHASFAPDAEIWHNTDELVGTPDQTAQVLTGMVARITDRKYADRRLNVFPGELRHAEWAEIDFEKKQFRIPAEKMKMKRIHIVPLAEQAIAILRQIQPVTGQGKYVFPSVRSRDRAMSENTVTAALRRMGFTKEEMTAHGFRGMASTLLHENGFKSDVIEAQLAHAQRNKVKAAYNHAEYLSERAEMMNWWADYLDELRSSKP